MIRFDIMIWLLMAIMVPSTFASSDNSTRAEKTMSIFNVVRRFFFISLINQDGEAKSLFLLNFVTVKDSPFLRSREKSFLEVPSL